MVSSICPTLLGTFVTLSLAALPACSSKSTPGGTGAGGEAAGGGGDGSGASGGGKSSASGGGGSSNVGSGGSAPGKRDAHQQPFASTSIWNMPIGSDAVYVDANLRPVPGGGTVWAEPFSDTDYIVLVPDAPLVDVRYSDAGWDADKNRCDPSSSKVWTTVPIPDDYVVDNGPFNNAAAVLAQDGRTFMQFEPLARCTKGGVATSLVLAQSADIYGDGILGGHGGSGMSTIGGTLRLGELRPGQKGPRHALKFTMNLKEFYKCEDKADCFRWPAAWADSYAVGWYGTAPNNMNVDNKAMKMGALLAIPPDVDIASIGLATEAAKELAWTLQNYGAYVDEDTHGPSFLIGTEFSPDGSFQVQFKADYGFDFNQASDSGQDWTNDIQKIMPKLKVIDNNSADHIGGGGTPRQPLAPELVH